MSSLNKSLLIGHLGADPEVRRTQDGKPVASFNLATSENWRDKATGEKRQRTEWHRIVIFNEQLVKIAEQYLKKGAKVFIEGAMHTRKYTNAAGHEASATEVVLSAFGSSLVMLDRSERTPGPGGEGDYGSSAPDKPPASAPPPIDDEIPF